MNNPSCRCLPTSLIIGDDRFDARNSTDNDFFDRASILVPVSSVSVFLRELKINKKNGNESLNGSKYYNMVKKSKNGVEPNGVID